MALYSARHDRETIRFNMINPATGSRIKMVSQDAQTGEEVARRDTVKGYEVAKGQYVIITDEDLDSVRVESSGIMKVEKFVDAASIDPIYYDASYYLAPDSKGSEDVYAVLREAIARTGKVALTRVVISQRERTVALRPMDGGLVAHTLNEQRDLNPAEHLFDSAKYVHLDPEMIALATQLVERQSEDYDPADLEDRYETRLRAMLDAKIKGEGVRTDTVPALADSNVIDLMAALRKSLGQPLAPAEPTVKAEANKPAKRARKSGIPDVRTQPALKLPLQGGKEKRAQPQADAAQEKPAGRGRRRA
ncbi:MAG: Ku protein [Pseudomonadota bacterium]|nr:Ku protein [Pseudomonadota bacterium]